MTGRRTIPGIPPSREEHIRSQARSELKKLWVTRHDYGLQVDDREAFLRTAQVTVPQCRFGFEVIHEEDIPSDDADFKIAGILDRHAKRILVARNFPLPCRRFTLAHEVGHLVLHPGRVYHRERPLNGGEHLDSRRSVIEREADLFAAEFLMPTNILKEVFRRCFGGAIDVSDCDDDMCYCLSQATGTRITQQRFRSMACLDRARLIARVRGFGVTPFPSLLERFSVSPTAMAIQLRDLGLVI